MRLPTRFLALFVLCLSSTAFAGGDGWWSDVWDEQTVPLSKILENPVSYRGLDVSFVIQFHQVGTLENPFYTRFEKETYLNFACWGDESRLWEKEAYKNDFPYMFIDRSAADCSVLARAQMYDRFVVVGRVDGVFRGKPWIEVRGLEPLDQKLTEPSLAHMVKAYTLKRVRRYDAAAAEFQLSRVKELPDGVKLMTLKEQGMCLAAADRCDDAVEPLEQALKLAPKDAELVRLCAQVKDRAEAMKKDEEASGKEKKETPAPENEDPPKGELTKKENGTPEETKKPEESPKGGN